MCGIELPLVLVGIIAVLFTLYASRFLFRHDIRSMRTREGELSLKDQGQLKALWWSALFLELFAIGIVVWLAWPCF